MSTTAATAAARSSAFAAKKPVERPNIVFILERKSDSTGSVTSDAGTGVVMHWHDSASATHPGIDPQPTVSSNSITLSLLQFYKPS